MWARLLSRNRRNLERVLRLDSQQHEQAEPSALLYEEGGPGTFKNRVVAAAGEEEEEWQLFAVSWEDIAEAVWNKQSDLFAPTSLDNPYLEREIGDEADLADITLQREVAGGAIRDNSGGGDLSTTRTASSTSASRASGDSSGRHESTDDDNSDESTQDENTKKRKAKKGGQSRGGLKKQVLAKNRIRNR